MLDYELPIPGSRIRSETKGFNKLNNFNTKNERTKSAFNIQTTLYLIFDIAWFILNNKWNKIVYTTTLSLEFFNSSFDNSHKYAIMKLVDHYCKVD